MSAHLTTPEQEAELLAILREIAPEKREDGWHLLEDCDTRGEVEWLDDTAHDQAYEELRADLPPWPSGMVHPRRRPESDDPEAAEAEWDAYWERHRVHSERVDARAAEIRPTLAVPSTAELCAPGCQYPRARALLRAIEGS